MSGNTAKCIPVWIRSARCTARQLPGLPFSPSPGRGRTELSLPDGRRVAVLNLQGTTFMDALPCPFAAALERIRLWDESLAPRVRLVDFHAEATSKKRRWDGRWTAG